MLLAFCQTPRSAVETEIAVIKTEITNQKETVNNGFDPVQKNFDGQNNIIIACIGIPLAILAIGATIAVSPAGKLTMTWVDIKQ